MEGNGDGTKLIHIGLKGKRRVQIGDDWPIFTVDCVALSTKWAEESRDFFDDKGMVHPGKQTDLNTLAVLFFRKVFETHTKFASQPEADKWGKRFDEEISVADALHFITAMADESNDLKNFFVPKRLREDKDSSTEPSFREPLEARFGE